jgi:O-antigen/teichoic acid export membrane protein
MLQVAFLLAGSSGVLSIIRFGRNVLIARLIGVEDFGIASTFALLMALVEMLSDLAIGRLVVQDRDGDSPGFVAALQAIAIVRGATLSAVVFVLADPIAVLLGQPGLGWAYRIMAVMPVLRALWHLDIARQQRAMRFGLRIKADFAGVTAGFAALWPLWLWLGDFRVMLGLLIVETGVVVATTHLLAERRYRLGWDGAVAGRALRFGWPVLASGVVAFAVVQGERLIVANQLTATDLGLFSAALTLAMAPTAIVHRIVSSMFLPLLARHQDNERAFLPRAELMLETLLASGLGLMLVYVLAGPAALRLVYGAEFAAGAQLVAIIGIACALRIVRSASVDISVARGNTVNLLIPSVVRFASFPAAFLVAVRGGSLEAIALTGVAGEAVALVVAYLLVAFREGLVPVLVRGAPAYGIAIVLVLLLTAIAAGLVGGPVPAVAAVLLGGVVVALCRRFLGYLRNELLKVRRRRE